MSAGVAPGRDRNVGAVQPRNDPRGPKRQRLCLVLPTTGEFDSRTYRIASAMAARGHEVTVVARLAPGLEAEEYHPAGYRVVRVPVSAVDGLPLPRWARSPIERWRARKGHGPAARDFSLEGGAGEVDGSEPGRAGRTAIVSPEGADLPTDPVSHAGTDQHTGSASHEGANQHTARISRVVSVRRAVAAVVRVAAIALTVRSQVRGASRVAPAADLYHGMAYMGIPVALALGRRHAAPVVYDARDIYVDANNLARLPWPARRVLGWIERRWARSAARVITVNRPYAEVMAERFGVSLPAIVLNCAYRFDAPEPRPRRFHEALGLAAGTRVVLYQGGFSRDRGIEQLVASIADVPRAVLVLMGYGVLESELAAIAADPAAGGRVQVLPAVAPSELLSWVAGADVVAMPIQPTTLNHRLTTPNKLFEAMAAGVPVVASDLPGMSTIVADTGCGLLVDPTDPTAISGALRAIIDAPPERWTEWRTHGLAAARETYNWERQVDILAAEYARLTGRPW